MLVICYLGLISGKVGEEKVSALRTTLEKK